ncbi:unnamed protein product [Brassica napus]|uniref:(rape) hypothetical protein n=1 Tax=Brassica napus TaxID=3708 RepID=A0A816W8K5_BRANA|nr:unnamed protein product [Brassica napus]
MDYGVASLTSLSDSPVAHPSLFPFSVTDVPWIVDPDQDGAQLDPTEVSPSDDATMELNGSNDQLTFEDIIELDTHEHFGRAGQSDTYLGELVELNLSDNYISELDELSDTSLELNELSDIEDGAGLVSGRNGPFSAQRKIHNKFNLGRFYTKFDQTFPQSISSPFSSRIPRGSQQGSLSREWEKEFNKNH